MTKEELEKLIHGYAIAMYEMGLEDGMKLKPSLIYEQYEKGLNDAWECARKIFNWNPHERALRFGDKNCMNGYSAQEAIAKIKEYDEKQKKSCMKCKDWNVHDGSQHCTFCQNYSAFKPKQCDEPLNYEDFVKFLFYTMKPDEWNNYLQMYNEPNKETPNDPS